MHSNDIIKLSDDASNFILNLFKSNSIPESYYFRITAHGSKGEIIEYKFGFDADIRPSDTIVEFDDFKIILDSETLYNIEGSTISFKGNSSEGKLIFDNPFKNLTNHNTCKH